MAIVLEPLLMPSELLAIEDEGHERVYTVDQQLDQRVIRSKLDPICMSFGIASPRRFIGRCSNLSHP